MNIINLCIRSKNIGFLLIAFSLIFSTNAFSHGGHGHNKGKHEHPKGKGFKKIPLSVCDSIDPAQVLASLATVPKQTDKYGDDDTLGSLNLMTDKSRKEALKLVKKGKVEHLGAVLGRDSAAFGARVVEPYLYLNPSFSPFGINHLTFIDDVMAPQWLGVGSQIDGLAHIGSDEDRHVPDFNYQNTGGSEGSIFYNRITMDELIGPEGCTPPLINCRRLTSGDVPQTVIDNIYYSTDLSGATQGTSPNEFPNFLNLTDQTLSNTAIAGGVQKLGIQDLPPIVARGIVLDMTKVIEPLGMTDEGEPYLTSQPNLTVDGTGQIILDPSFDPDNVQGIECKDIVNALNRQKLKLKKGDVVIIHTGWLNALERGAIDNGLFARATPGLTLSAAQYLVNNEVMISGTDSYTPDLVPNIGKYDGTDAFVIHNLLLVNHGIYILEVMNTQPFIDKGIDEFAFVLGVPRYQGTVQGSINPTALY